MKSLIICAVIIAISSPAMPQDLKDAAPCDSQIYCDGPLLNAVQESLVFDDSKTYVDLHLLKDAATVLAAFGELDNPVGDKDVMTTFVEDNFDGPADEFEAWTPTDWNDSPAVLDKIKDENLRDWASDLNDFWKDLGRQIKEDVKTSSDRYSLVYVDNPFVVPGGRFREFYYWDSYWIIKGLLISGMTETVKGMLGNFLSMVDQLGYVPNGNRIYYQRSQPPFLIPSINEYLKATNDFAFVQSALPTLAREYEFWMANRTAVVSKPGAAEQNYTLNRYDVFMGKPRPESYRQDVETASGLSDDEKAEVYSNLASAAESGWDFSSRWFGPQNTLTSIRTKQIVPVDLNGILCLNEQLLADFYQRAGDSVEADRYAEAHQARLVAFRDIFWSESAGIWFDYDLETSAHNNQFYLSSIVPMWAGCYGDEVVSAAETEAKVYEYFQQEGVLLYPGGVPTSKISSGQQWDFPNAWPPLQHMLIEAFSNSDHGNLQQWAFDLAQKWVLTNYISYKETGVMYEKYDVTNQGVPGHGGEYPVQAGFGWTNGVILSLLDTYGDSLDSAATVSHLPNANVAVGLTVVVLLSFF